ncbi:hypothetical protein QUF72_17775 [Desulfobacterales bacterium HSG2]|nr:hypothetical protein [Desulfobacterales bacterium HSG2]
MHKLKIAIGIFITMPSIFFIMTAATDLYVDPEPEVERLVTVLAFFSVIGIFGLCMTIANIIMYRKKERKRKERLALKVIASKGGCVMPVEIAAETNLLIHEAREALDRLCKSGMGRLQETEEGDVVYVFEDIVIDHEGTLT